ncbi:MAG: hypothetical protein KJZ54_10815 [Phycisphaerales bacterium]|nr:hypothetical protein [Phycisphaerales bacterium]
MSAGDAIPDHVAVEFLTEVIATSWCEVVHHSPEAELDATLWNCSILRGRAKPPKPIDQNIWRIVSIQTNGEFGKGDVWDHIRACPKEFSVDIDCYVCGIKCRMIVRGGMASGVFDCECVFADRDRQPFEVGDDVFRRRVQEWCEAVVKLGEALDAERVEVEGGRHFDDVFVEEPIVLWKRE